VILQLRVCIAHHAIDVDVSIDEQHCVDPLLGALRDPYDGRIANARYRVQHAFDIFRSIRTAHVVGGTERFLAGVYSGWLRGAAAQRAADGASTAP